MKRYILILACVLQCLAASGADKSDRFWRFKGEIVDMKFPKMELLNPAINTAIDSLSEVLRDPRRYNDWYNLRLKLSDKNKPSQDFLDTRQYFILKISNDPVYQERSYVYIHALENDSYPIPLRECDVPKTSFGVYEYKGKQFLTDINDYKNFREMTDSASIPVQIENDDEFLTDLERPTLSKQIFCSVTLKNQSYHMGTSENGRHYQIKNQKIKTYPEKDFTLNKTQPSYDTNTKKAVAVAKSNTTGLSHNDPFFWYYDYMTQAGYNWPVICHKEHFFCRGSLL